MGNNNTLRLLYRNEIDEQRWQELIDKSPDSLVYFHSWYLDCVSPGWAAFVTDDYTCAMPLTLKKKMGIHYLRQPLYCQQLGIFPKPGDEIIREFFKNLNRRFSYAEINFNAGFSPVDKTPNFTERHNYLLNLNTDYETLKKSYNQHTKRKLKKAAKNNLTLKTNIDLQEFAGFKKENLKFKQNKNDIERLFTLMDEAIERNTGEIYAVYSPKKILLAAAFFIRHKKRITYLNAVSSPEGKDNQAMFYLIDRFIEDHASKDVTVDFEGSMIPGVARLYKGFGAFPEIYYRYKMNNLPWWLKWIKK